AVLYEMVTGRRAFPGKSQLSVASAILEKEPEPMSTIKPMTPLALDHVVRRCLAKDPEERWQTGRDLAQELKWVEKPENIAGRPAKSFAHLIGRPKLAWTLIVALLGVAGLALWGWMRATGSTPRPVMRWANVFPLGQTVITAKLSGDGSHLAYRG